MKTIELPRRIIVDLWNFDTKKLVETVQEEFEQYTSGTNPSYMYQDKLLFIDLMVQRLHHADSGEKVNRLIKKTFEYQLDEYGEMMEPSEFLSKEFMEDCYNLGQEDHKLYSRNFTGDHHIDERIMLIETIVIKAVMDYERRADMRGEQDEQT